MPVPQAEAALPCSTTPNPNHSATGDVAQTRFHDRFGRIRKRPPDQAIARESFAEAVGDRQSWRRGDRTVSKGVVWSVFMAVYARSSYGLALTIIEDLAGDCGFSKRHVIDAMQVLRVELKLVAMGEPRRGCPTTYEIRPFGMTWRMACHLAAAVEDQPTTVEDQPTTGVASRPLDPPATSTPASGVLVSRSGVTRTPYRVLGEGTTTTPPDPPDGGGWPPASTAKQRGYALDVFGVDVSHLNIAEARELIRHHRENRQVPSAAPAGPEPPRRPRRPRGPGARLRHPDTGRRFTAAELRSLEKLWAVGGYPEWAVQQLQQFGIEFK